MIWSMSASENTLTDVVRIVPGWRTPADKRNLAEAWTGVLDEKLLALLEAQSC